MATFLDQSLGTFLDALAAEEPTPGGGGTAALAAALAAGLVAMGARFSRAQLPDAEERAARADRARAEVVALAPADATAYGAVLAALRAPRGDEGRSDRVRDAFDGAARVPVRIAEVAALIAAEAAHLAEHGNPNLRGDALAGLELARAAVRSAVTLVRLNAEAGGLGPELVDRAEAAAATADSAAKPPPAY